MGVELFVGIAITQLSMVLLSIILTPWRLRQEDNKFKASGLHSELQASLGYGVEHSQNE